MLKGRNHKSPGEVIISLGNAVILEKEGEIRICGAGRVSVQENEVIIKIFDLRPQTFTTEMENVITADLIPVSLQYRVGFRIKPAPKQSSENECKIISDKQGLFPVYEHILLNAAFNLGLAGWEGFGKYAVMGKIRDQFMKYTFNEIFNLEITSQDSIEQTNIRTINQIENAIRTEFDNVSEHTGVELTNISLRQFNFPKYIKDKVLERFATEISTENFLISTNVEDDSQTIKKELVKGRLMSLKKQLIEYNRRLWKLEEKQAKMGMDVEPSVITEIEDCTQRISELENEFSQLAGGQT